MQLNYMQPTYSTFGASSLYNISLVASNASVLPPMLNAIEVYYMIPHNESTTSPGDVDAVMAIKSQYHVSKNWMGDPCLPKEYMWNGLQCRPDGVESKIISLDLSGNHLDGTIPEALCTKGSLNLRYDTNNGDPCNGKSPKKNISVLTVAIVTPVAAVLLPTEIPNSGTHVDIKGHILMSKDHEFTYEDLVKITRKFSECIGEGGFGPVYHGQLQSTEGSIHVAVKMCSRKSVHGQGIREFLAEVDSLKTVHHKHLVMLIGYCTNKNHLALIYEYMPNGNMHAKISDFGLSKSYNNEAQTHISVTAAGTTGYIDPEYYFSSRLTVKSDVFSFGVVLLEILTGEPPILPGVGHVVKHVEQKVSNGDISEVVDPRLKDAYDIGSVWKVVDIALLCTKDVSDERPTMIEVVDQLKDALTLEEIGKFLAFPSCKATATSRKTSNCGLPSGSSYLDEKTGLNYISDDGYIYTGENNNISQEYNGEELLKTGLNLRSFPTGVETATPCLLQPLAKSI
uniref:Protein kinase domain-containing protein n=1 Tax=Leersia perrieri TaxID=77586 RepID=A0A0D9XCU0_9ORYZ